MAVVSKQQQLSVVGMRTMSMRRTVEGRSSSGTHSDDDAVLKMCSDRISAFLNQ